MSVSTNKLSSFFAKHITTEFLRIEILELSLQGFSIILAAEDAIHLFDTLLRLSRLALAERHNRKPQLSAIPARRLMQLTRSLTPP